VVAFHDDQVRQVQDATDIVALVGEHVTLKPKGREYVGLCPFHDDKNPSMCVVPNKQIFHCFVCNTSGNAFGWMQKFHRMAFREALQHLAERAGITLKPRDRKSADGQVIDEHQEAAVEQGVAGANAQAMSFFRALLQHEEHGRVAREYLADRGFTQEMIDRFQVGYAPDRWDGLVRTIASKRWPVQGFVDAGLITRRQATGGGGNDGFDEGAVGGNVRPVAADSCYDRLRHRLIFPICDVLGRPIAFGGRKLREEDEPKYLNSPETVLFNKSATLFGLNLAHGAISKSRTAVIVEGYTDVLACHQAGVTNVVATLGTALTSQHAAQLRRRAEKVVLIFDADEAGQRAADRAVEVFLTEPLDVHVAVLPDGQDPAELLGQSNGFERWQQAIDKAPDALTYQYERVRERVESATSTIARQREVEGYMRQLVELGMDRLNVSRMGFVRQRIAELLQLTSHEVDQLFTRFMRAAQRRQRERQSSDRTPDASPQTAASTPGIEGDIVADEPLPFAVPADGSHVEHAVTTGVELRALALAERQIIGALLRQPELFHEPLAQGHAIDEALPPAMMVTAAGGRLYERLYEHLISGNAITLSHVMTELAAGDHHDLADLAAQAEHDAEAHSLGESARLLEMVASAVQRIRDHHQRHEHDVQYRSLRADAASDDALATKALDLQRQLVLTQTNTMRIARMDA
jgi:DNA primase